MNQVTRGAAEALQLMRSGSFSTSRDVLKHSIYDCKAFTAATVDATTTLFSVPISGVFAAVAKTLNETNLYDTGKLPTGQVMLINRMSLYCVTNVASATATGHLVAQALINVLHSSVFEIKILGGREWDFQVHGTKFLPTIAFFGATGATNIVSAGGQTVSFGSVKLDPTPIVIDSQVGINVIHRWGNAIAAINTILAAEATVLNTANARFYVSLDGILSRGK